MEEGEAQLMGKVKRMKMKVNVYLFPNEVVWISTEPI